MINRRVVYSAAQVTIGSGLGLEGFIEINEPIVSLDHHPVRVTHTRVFRGGRVQHVVIARGRSGRFRCIDDDYRRAVTMARDLYGGVAAGRRVAVEGTVTTARLKVYDIARAAPDDT